MKLINIFEGCRYFQLYNNLFYSYNDGLLQISTLNGKLIKEFKFEDQFIFQDIILARNKIILPHSNGFKSDILQGIDFEKIDFPVLFKWVDNSNDKICFGFTEESLVCYDIISYEKLFEIKQTWIQFISQEFIFCKKITDTNLIEQREKSTGNLISTINFNVIEEEISNLNIGLFKVKYILGEYNEKLILFAQPGIFIFYDLVNHKSKYYRPIKEIFDGKEINKLPYTLSYLLDKDRGKIFGLNSKSIIEFNIEDQNIQFISVAQELNNYNIDIIKDRANPSHNYNAIFCDALENINYNISNFSPSSYCLIIDKTELLPIEAYKIDFVSQPPKIVGDYLLQQASNFKLYIFKLDNLKK